MPEADIDQLLQEGIRAVRNGQRAEGRQLLLQVVEADEANEQGWYWLSLAVETTPDKITALENVLTLNPVNETAQLALQKLQTAETDSPSPLESVSTLDDPYQCIYCGAPAPHELKACPECKRSLLVKRTLDQSREVVTPLRLTALLLMLQTNCAIIELQVHGAEGQNFLFTGLRLDDYFGLLPTTTLPLMQSISTMRGALLAVLIVGLLYKVALSYYATAAIMIADIVWVGIRLAFRFIGLPAAVVGVLLDLATCYFLFASDRSFTVNEQRLLCLLDRGSKGGVALNHLGRRYKREGKWALAVAHWRAAVAAMPHQADFYKDLAIGYAQIGYYRRALKALEEFAHRSPDDPDLASVKILIEQKRAADSKPRD